MLHNLLAQDKDTGYVSLFQTLAPDSYFIGQKTLQPVLALRAPRTRPMDDVLLDMQGPQEEEFAMAHASGLSFYAGWYFPNAMEKLFDTYALLRCFPRKLSLDPCTHEKNRESRPRP